MIILKIQLLILSISIFLFSCGSQLSESKKKKKSLITTQTPLITENNSSYLENENFASKHISLMDFSVPPGENRLVSVQVNWMIFNQNVSSSFISSATFEGEELILASHASRLAFNLTLHSAIFYLPLGSKNIIQNQDGIQIEFNEEVLGSVVSVSSFTGIHQTTPLNKIGNANLDSANSFSLEVDLEGAGLIIDSIMGLDYTSSSQQDIITSNQNAPIKAGASYLISEGIIELKWKIKDGTTNFPFSYTFATFNKAN